MKRLCLLIPCFAFFFASAQKGSLGGTIITADGKPAMYLNIGLKGTGKGTLSDDKGNYEIKNIEPGNYTLLISHIGLETKEQAIEVKSGERSLIGQITLKEDAKQLAEVVITAVKSENEKTVSIGKIAIRPIDLPQSISHLDREIMNQQQTLHLSDAIKNFNGIYLMGTSGGYQEELAGRGFAYNSSNTFKNGVRFNNSVMPEMSSLERVEVMKGSSAILFGNVAAGGVINLVTKKPLFVKGGEVSMRIGSYNFYKPAIDVYGSINNSKKAAYRINAAYEKSESFRDYVKGEHVYINPSFLFRPWKKTEILIEADYLDDFRTADFGVGSINYSLIDIPRTRFIGVSWSYYKAQQKSLTSTITHHLNSRWKITQVTSFQNFKSDLFANQRPNGNSQFISTNGDWIRGLQRTRIDEEYYIAQLDLTGKFSTGTIKHQFLFGADMDQYQTNNMAYNAVARYDTINVFDPAKYKQRNDIPDLTPKTNTGTPIKRTGIYIQDLVSLTENIKLLAGVRYSYLETSGDVFTYATGTTISTKQTDKAFTPRIGVVYQPLKTMSLFASYSNSFTPNSGVDINGKSLAPSTFSQYEAGMKNDLLKGVLSANLTFYYIINANMAQMSLANGNTNTNVKELVGEVTSRGVELDLMSREWNGFSLIGGYSFNDTRYTKSNTYIEGSKLRYNPNHTANMGVYYTFRQYKAKWINGLNAGVGALYIGDRAAGRSTRVTVANDAYKLISLPSYTNLEASLGYSKNDISIRVKLSNILDVLSYNVHDDNSVNPIASRQISATFAIRF